MTKPRRAPHVVETKGSAFFDLFEPAEAERLSIQSGLALVLERAIAARKWTQAEAARRLGITQPRVNDLLRGRLEKFSIDALIVYLVRMGVPVRIETSAPTRRRRPAARRKRGDVPRVVTLMDALQKSRDTVSPGERARPVAHGTLDVKKARRWLIAEHADRLRRG